jgi:hypothetical protein
VCGRRLCGRRANRRLVRAGPADPTRPRASGDGFSVYACEMPLRRSRAASNFHAHTPVFRAAARAVPAPSHVPAARRAEPQPCSASGSGSGSRGRPGPRPPPICGRDGGPALPVGRAPVRRRRRRWRRGGACDAAGRLLGPVSTCSHLLPKSTCSLKLSNNRTICCRVSVSKLPQRLPARGPGPGPVEAGRPCASKGQRVRPGRGPWYNTWTL